MSASLEIARPFSSGVWARASDVNMNAAPAIASTIAAVAVAGTVIGEVLLSIQIRSDGSSRKSAIRASVMVIAVSFAMSPFTAKPDWASTANPATRPRVVTNSAMPTDLNV